MILRCSSNLAKDAGLESVNTRLPSTKIKLESAPLDRTVDSGLHRRK